MLSLIPVEWRIGLAAGALLAAFGGIGAGGLYLHHRWYGEGFDAALAQQLAANQTAIRNANTALMRAADDLSLKSLELDDALKTIDAASAARPGGDLLCLDSRRVRDLGAIR